MSVALREARSNAERCWAGGFSMRSCTSSHKSMGARIPPVSKGVGAMLRVTQMCPRNTQAHLVEISLLQRSVHRNVNTARAARACCAVVLASHLANKSGNRKRPGTWPYVTHVTRRRVKIHSATLTTNTVVIGIRRCHCWGTSFAPLSGQAAALSDRWNGAMQGERPFAFMSRAPSCCLV